MSILINGKTLNEVLKELQEPFPEDLFQEVMGKKYLPCSVMKGRLEKVVGFSYLFTVSEPKLITINTQHNLICTGELSLLSDDGTVVAKRGALGGAKCIISNETGEPTKLSNDAESASKDVFKRCMKAFGIGEDQLHEMRASSFSAPVKDSERYEAVLQSKIMKIPKGYKATVSIDDEQFELIIWEDKVKGIEKAVKRKMSEFIEMVGPGNTLFINATSQVYNGKPQLTFTSFSGKEKI